jgi:antitoxin FitA
MASITIRQLDDALKAKLRIQAAQHGHSMEEEMRQILRAAVMPDPSVSFSQQITQRFATLGGVELIPFTQEPLRTPPEFTS